MKELKEYKELFKSEVKEIIEKCEEIILKIEKEGIKREFIDELFRYFHTIKGSAASVGEEEIEKISHRLEDMLDKIRKEGKKQIEIEEILKSIDKIKKLLKEKIQKYEIEIYLSPETPLKGARAFVILERLKEKFRILKVEPDIEEIKQDKFDFSFKVELEIEEQNVEELKEILNLYSEIEHYKILEVKEKEIIKKIKEEEITEIKIKSEVIDRIINYMGEVLIERDKLKKIISEKGEKEIKEEFDSFERLLASIQDEIVSLRLIPVKVILSGLPRYVRDESKKLGKEIEIEIEGEEIEVDRILLEKLKDPIIHLVRNSIDHGIEKPEERIKNGKKRVGKISISIKKDRGIVFISVKDDGEGINREKVVKRALELGIIKEEETSSISDEKIVEILTNPLFSTKKDVTSLSGRGVGLNVVKETLLKIGGDLKINFEEKKGTEVILRIPVSLAIIKAVIVESGEEKYVLPLNYVTGIYNVKNIKIFTLQGKKFTIINKKIYPVYEFDYFIGVKNNGKECKEGIAVEGEDISFVLLISRVISEQDVFVKNLNEIFMRIPFITGGTILGDGKPYFIIDPISLIKKGG
ncbi:MAG: ATP-binding protein [candidate division WOR-3 bacterium]